MSVLEPWTVRARSRSAGQSSSYSMGFPILVVRTTGLVNEPSPSCSGHEGLGSGRVDRQEAWGQEQSTTAMQRARHPARTSANHVLPPGSTWAAESTPELGGGLPSFPC